MVPDDEVIVLSLLWPRQCGECNDGYYLRLAAARNEVIFDDEGNIVGIEGTFRFMKCGHPVPDVTADPLKIALRLEYVEEMD